MPKVSVVMPVYNGEAYLGDAIQSIVDQTFKDWEFIIVNEFGSNEETVAILRDYAAHDTRIRIIQNKERLRIAESLNVGLREAKGQYIARMDADDIAGPNRLAIQVKYLDEHPDIDICGLKVEMFGEHTWDWKVYSNPKYLQCATLFYIPFVHPTIMMRSDSLKAEGLEYNKEFFYTEDYEFFERAAEKLRFTNLECPGSYHYRYVSTNATNVGGSEGVRLQNQVVKRAFKRWGLEFSNEQIRYLSPNSYPHAFDSDVAQDDLSRLDLLLKEIFLCDSLRDFYGEDILFRVLHRRWLDAYESYRWQAEVVHDGQVERAIHRGLFFREHFYNWQKQKNDVVVPRVSVVIPTYNSESYIMDTLFSLLEQDFTDTEILIVNEPTTNDRTVACIQLFKDERIRLIQNQTRLGLAESLNVGIRGAKGEYIARADADDVYPSDRFSKQVKFLDEHPEISVCGSWQRHFGKRNYIHQPPETKEEMKASLLFGCEVCHSTVMMRRKDILSLDKLYDPNYLSEDYELWSRAAQTLNFATIPEVLGEYRWNGENITAKKMNLLDIEAQKIVRRNLEQSLDMQVSNDDLILLSGWNNPFQEENEDQFDLREREKVLLDEIEEINKNKQVFDQSALEKVLDRRRIWAGIKQEDILFMAKAIAKENSENKLKLLLKKLLKPLYRPIRQRFENRLISIQESVWRQDGIATEAVQSIHDMDGHLYDYFSALDKKIAEQNAVQIEMQKQLTAITQHILELQTTIERVSDTQRGFEGQYDDLRSEVEDYRHSLDKVLLTLGEVEENLGQQLNDRVEKAENYIQTQNVETITNAQKDTEQRILNELESEKKEIIQSTDTRIWKAEKLINQTTDGRIWKMERNVRHDVRAGFQNVYLANCLSRDNQNTEVSMTYDDIFYFENRAGSVMSARAILSTLLPHLECRSMVDFGCGTGTWLWVAHGFGVESIRGLDGDYVPPRQLMIPQDCFCAVDLEEPVVLEKKYDLAISMEVAEHLHKESADTFVESLCNAADTILFSAAHPGQGGDGHINEQPMTYWTSKFGKHGFLPVEIRQLFEGNEDIESWYRENIVLYVREAKVRRVEKNLLGKSE